MTCKLASEVIVVQDDLVLLLRRSSGAERRPGQWDLPGGHAEAGETDSQAALRELREETGIEFKQADIRLVYAMTEMAEPEISVTWVYFTAVASEHNIVLSSEHAELKWADIEEACRLVEYSRHNAALRYIRDNHLL